ncbi:MAG: ABC transporter substrate-binding protein, partial [Cetobacterium sp.]
MKKILLLTGSLALLLMSCGEKETENTKVNMHMWGGSQEINKFMDEIIAPELKKQNNIDLNRIPVTDIKDTVNKLIVEKKAGKKNGTADILWVNGENFKQLKEAQVLSENITENLSNIGMVNKSTLVKDFGEPINGMVVP